MDKHPDIKLNPHPVQRYELTATVDAPGPFDSVTGYVSYDVTNVECVPKDAWEGARNVPGSSHTFELTRVDDHTWKGYFYRDLLQDEDYFGLGICHWELGTVSPVFVVHGQSFNSGLMLPEVVGGQPNTRYFKVETFLDRSLTDDNAGSALSWSSRDKEVEAQPQRYFPITAHATEVKP
jgi:hypothetical protein